MSLGFHETSPWGRNKVAMSLCATTIIIIIIYNGAYSSLLHHHSFIATMTERTHAIVVDVGIVLLSDNWVVAVVTSMRREHVQMIITSKIMSILYWMPTPLVPTTTWQQCNYANKPATDSYILLLYTNKELLFGEKFFQRIHSLSFSYSSFAMLCNNKNNRHSIVPNSRVKVLPASLTQYSILYAFKAFRFVVSCY